MNQIERFRLRINNASKNAKEYRMTILEAKELLAEIDNITILKKEPVSTDIMVDKVPRPITRIIDGGTF